MSSMLTLAGNAAPTGFYDFPIEQSLRFEDGDNAYLSRTPASAGNRKTWTFSCWVKRGKVSGTDAQILTAYTSASDTTNIIFQSGGAIQWYDYISGYRVHLVTNALFRDVGSWYHFLFQLDTSNATSGDRAKIYVNGERVTSFSTEVYPSLNADLKMNTAIEHRIGDTAQFAREFDGYLADVNFVDGTAYTADSFGEIKSGIWTPKDTADLTFGTNGFRLAFADGAAIGDDTSGNTNDFTANNLVASDVVLDSPTNNFCTYNPNSRFGGNGTFSEGNLRFSGNSSGDMSTRTSTVIPVGMKFYFEAIYSEEAGSGGQARLGIDQTGSTREREKTGTGLFSFDFRGSAGVPQAYDENTVTTYGSQPAEGDVVGIAVDLENGKLYAHKANSYYNSGDPVAGTGAVITGIPDLQSVVFMSIDGGVNRNNWHINFGQDSTFAGRKSAGGNADENGLGDFAHPVPSGFLSLCSANLPSGAIDTLADETPEDYFNTVLYTGNGTSQSITGVGFSPDVLWLKERSSTSHHQLFHDIDGGVPKFMQTSSTIAEVQDSAVVSSFDADGFSVGNSGGSNQSGQTYVGWNWYTGASPTSNTDGSITSTVSVGATSQQNWFSIVSYTGNTTQPKTVGHGLGVTPDLILIKNRDTTDNWSVYHSSVMTGGDGKFMQLNTTAGLLTDGTDNVFDTGFSSTTFGIGRSSASGDASNFIAYCFANAEGLCKAGSYTGNNSADGTFVFTGHRPSFVMIKRTDASDSSSGWFMYDDHRDTDNVIFNYLRAESSAAEVTSLEMVDFLSNGFKIRRTGNAINASGGSYIFLSIASQPFKFSNAR